MRTSSTKLTPQQTALLKILYDRTHDGVPITIFTVLQDAKELNWKVTERATRYTIDGMCGRGFVGKVEFNGQKMGFVITSRGKERYEALCRTGRLEYELERLKAA